MNRRIARLIKLNMELNLVEMVPTPQYFAREITSVMIKTFML